MTCADATHANCYWSNSASSNIENPVPNGTQGPPEAALNSEEFDVIAQLLYLLVMMAACLKKIGRDRSVFGLEQKIKALKAKAAQINTEAEHNAAAQRAQAVANIVGGALEVGCAAFSAYKLCRASSKSAKLTKAAKDAKDAEGAAKAAAEEIDGAGTPLSKGWKKSEADRLAGEANDAAHAAATAKQVAEEATQAATRLCSVGRAANSLTTGIGGLQSAQDTDDAGNARQQQTLMEADAAAADYEESTGTDNRRAFEELVRVTLEAFERLVQAQNACDKAAWTLS